MLTLLVAMMMQTTTIEPDGPIYCDFPSPDGGTQLIYVELEPRPSLKDQPGHYRVAMTLNGQGPLHASATPITTTKDRDVLIQGRTKRQHTYSLGLREDGKAALNIAKPGASAEEVIKTTRIGDCHGHSIHLQKWLSQ